MRYIDIEQIQLPDNWQARADAKLNALRTAIQQAESDAQISGGDVEKARKTAITSELARSVCRNIWRELVPKLSELSKDKCWYSESLNPTADKDVDHFRPKNRVEEDPDHEGYWWKAFDWRNYRYSSQWCNQRRNDRANVTKGGKGDHFPLCQNSFRARKEEDDCDKEEPELLDPVDPGDWKLLTFRPNGESIPSAIPDTTEFARADKTILIYHLNCHELVNERRVVASQIERLVLELERILPNIKDLAHKRSYKNHEKDLLRLIRRDSEYSSAALAYARALVHKFEQGRPAKRQWLEEILNSQT